MAALMRLAGPPRRTAGFLASSVKEFKFFNVSSRRSEVTSSAAKKPESQERDVESMIRKRLNFNRGVSIKQFEDFYSSVKNKGPLSHADSKLLLHMCSIGPFDAPITDRLGLADQMWGHIQKEGPPMDMMLYNMRLKVYKGNRVAFDPLMEMNQIKALGLNPDRVTYELLIHGFCEKGDIQGANLILEAMDQAGEPIDVSVINSFITGHLNAGSVDAATGIFDVLKARNVSPNGETYLRFAEYYAEKGDLASVQKYIDTADELGLTLHHVGLLRVYSRLISHKHTDQGQQFLNQICDRGLFRYNSFEHSCQLVAEGYAKEAFELYLLMPKIDEIKADRSGSFDKEGGFLLLAMIRNNYSASDIMEMASRIAEQIPQTSPHKHALLWAYKENKPEIAVELLELMKAKNHNLQVPYFLPAICHYRDQKNIEGLYRCVFGLQELMTDNPDTGSDGVMAMLDFGLPALAKLGQARSDIGFRVKDKGLQKVYNTLFFLEDLKKKNLGVAMEQADVQSMDAGAFKYHEFRLLHRRACIEDSMLACKALAEFYPKMEGMDRGVLMTLNEQTLQVLLGGKGNKKLEEAVDYMVEKKLRIRKRFLQIGGFSSLPKELQKKIEELCYNFQRSDEREKRQHSMEDLSKMSTEQLEQLKQQRPTVLVHLTLLNRALADKDPEQVKLCLRELQAREIALNQRQAGQIAAFFIRQKDTENAEIYFDEYKKHKGSSYGLNLPLDLAALKVRDGDVSGAVKLINVAAQSTVTPNEMTEKNIIRSSSDMFSNCKTVKALDSIKDALLQKTDFVPKKLLMPLLTMYMSNVYKLSSDDAELVDKVKSVQTTTKLFPYLHPILTRLILNKNVSQLKEVMELGISQFGNNLFHHRLAFAFLSAGFPAKALVVLQTPGLRFMENEIFKNAQFLVERKEPGALASLVEVCSNFPHNRPDLLHQLIRAHLSVRDVTSAVDVLDQYTAACLPPAPPTLALLQSAVASAGLPTPPKLLAFLPDQAKASVDSSSSSSDSDSSSSSDSDSDKESASKKQTPKASSETLKESSNDQK